jgi:peptidoglycan/LPS O-acetylase OafA/YrhL
MAEPAPNNINAIRLVLSVSVLYSHSFPLALGYETTEPVAYLTGGQATIGSMAVAAFFALSGYLIAGSWERSSSWVTFALRRVRRIYPAYLVAGMVCYLAFPMPSSPEGAWGLFLLRNVPGSSVFANNPKPMTVNGSLWTIPFEAWSYVGIALMGAAGLLVRRRTLVGLLVASIVLAVLFEGYEINGMGKGLGYIIGWPRAWARLLPPIFAGILYHSMAGRFRWHPLLGLAAVSGLAIGAYLPLGMTVALPTCGTYLLFSAAFSPPWNWGKWITSHGDFSYGIYLYAFPIQQTVMCLIGHPVGATVLFALSIVPAFAAGIASWLLIEQRFLVARRRQISGGPVTRSESLAEPRSQAANRPLAGGTGLEHEPSPA